MTFGILFGYLCKSIGGSAINLAFFLGGLSGLTAIFINIFSFRNAKDLAKRLAR